jgi:hypothetical protein
MAHETIQCIRGLVLVMPSPGLGATTAVLIPVTGPMRGQAIMVSQAVSPAAGPVNLQQVDGEVTMVCGTLHRNPNTGQQVLQVSSVFPAGGGIGAIGP